MGRLSSIYAAALAPFAGAFEPAALLAEAEAATGLADWGGARWAEPRFRERLGLFCQGLEGAAALTALGRSRAHSRLHVLLCSRLRQIDRHRALAAPTPIAPPLVGTGLPRAGTTFLHGLLAADPGNRVATAAQAAIPVPPPGADGADEAERIDLYQRILAFQGFTGLTAIHPYAADVPEECVFIQEAACVSPLGAFYNAPAFSARLGEPADVADAYDWQKGMMETLQSEQAPARWLLKAPTHVMRMDALAATFPGAMVFVNHRDPGKVIPSMGSLYMAAYDLASDASVDPKALGPRLVATWSAVLDGLDRWREAHPEARILDVHYAELIADPIGAAERLYAAFGLELTGAVKQAMRAHLAVDHHGKGPARTYSLADFGLTETDIEDAFGPYLERRGVKREKRS